MKEHMNNIGYPAAPSQGRIFTVGFVGEFKRGKSTLINALLGREVLPADILPTTFFPYRVRWGPVSQTDILFKNGRRREGKAWELSRFARVPESESAAVREAVVYDPSLSRWDGVEFLDVPGLNNNWRMNAICEQAVPALDAAVMVLVPGSPFSNSEAEFLWGKLMTRKLGLDHIILVLNKMDSVRPGEREKLIAGIRASIREGMLEKIAAICGEDCAGCRAAQARLDNVRLCPVSSLDALEAKRSGDSVLLERSGLPAFEKALSELVRSLRQDQMKCKEEEG